MAQCLSIQSHGKIFIPRVILFPWNIFGVIIHLELVMTKILARCIVDIIDEPLCFKVIIQSLSLSPNNLVIDDVAKEHNLLLFDDVALSANRYCGQSVVACGHDCSNLALIQSFDSCFGGVLQLVLHN